MKHDLTPEIVEQLERQYQESIQRALQAHPVPRAPTPDADKLLPCDALEELGFACWLLAIMAIGAYGGIFGPAVQAFARGLVA